VAPNLFAMQRQIVLEKRHVAEASVSLSTSKNKQVGVRRAA
jgi:hypothetical protein